MCLTIHAGFYPGTVTAFDEVRQQHALTYDDGDREIIALWAPSQRVRLHRNNSDGQ